MARRLLRPLIIIDDRDTKDFGLTFAERLHRGEDVGSRTRALMLSPASIVSRRGREEHGLVTR
jgi:hypothetical protein